MSLSKKEGAYQKKKGYLGLKAPSGFERHKYRRACQNQEYGHMVLKISIVPPFCGAGGDGGGENTQCDDRYGGYTRSQWT